MTRWTDLFINKLKQLQMSAGDKIQLKLIVFVEENDSLVSEWWEESGGNSITSRTKFI